MARFVVFLAAVLVLLDSSPPAAGQRARRRPSAPRLQRGPAEITCPASVGTGVTTRRSFCDVLIGRDPAEGILLQLPPHTGPATLMFDLHNRHTYSEELVRTGRAFTRYTATTGVLTMENNLVGRAVVQTEFRKAADLFDRIAGGAAPGGVKAVAPTGVEPILMTIPAGIDQVSVLGERLIVVHADGTDTFIAPGRPIAMISGVTVEYRPAPKKPPARKPPAKKPGAKPDSR